MWASHARAVDFHTGRIVTPAAVSRGFAAASLRKRFPKANEAAITLLERMLVFDPRERVTAADALADPYFGALHDDNDEPDAAPFDFSFEDTRDGMPLDEKALRKEIWASSPERR